MKTPEITAGLCFIALFVILMVFIAGAFAGVFVDRNRGPGPETTEWIIPDPSLPSTLPPYGKPVLAAYLYFGRTVFTSIKRMHALAEDGLPMDKWIFTDSGDNPLASDLGLPAAYTKEPRIPAEGLFESFAAPGKGPGKP